MTARKIVSEEKKLKAELKAIEKQREDVISKLRRLAPQEKKPKNPPRQNLWIVVREHLNSLGGSDTIEGVIDALRGNGHDLGKYPRRTIKQCVVSPHLRHVFSTYYVSGREFVEVGEGANTIRYLPLPARKKSQKPE